jgi:hypothetical protein
MNAQYLQGINAPSEKRRPKLEEAIASGQEILKVATKDELPQLWTSSQRVLAALQCALAKEVPDEERRVLLKSAVALLRDTQEFDAKSQNPTNEMRNQQQLSTALHLLSESLLGDEKIEALTESIAALNKVMLALEKFRESEAYGQLQAKLDAMNNELAEARQGK